MSDTMTPMTVRGEWDATIQDAFRTSDFINNRGSAGWAVARAVIIVLICLIGLADLSFALYWTLHGFRLNVSWLRAIYFALLGPVMIFAPRLRTLVNVRGSIGALGPHTIEARPDYVRFTARDLDGAFRWSVYPSVAIYRNDLYLRLPGFRANGAPRRAFGSAEAARVAFDRIRAFHASGLLAAGPAVAAAADVWPPAPQRAIEELPATGPSFTPQTTAQAIVTPAEVRRATWSLFPQRFLPVLLFISFVGLLAIVIEWPLIGVQSIYLYAALIAFALVRNLVSYGRSLGRLKEGISAKFETDYEWLRLSYPDGVTAMRVAAIPKISARSTGLYIAMGPLYGVIVPKSVFGSRENMMDVGRRLQPAARADKAWRR